MPRNYNLALLPIALFAALTAPAQPINWDSVRADYITKYQPQQLPAWLFPIIFEEGGGQRDTIYLGWDANAQDFGYPQRDTVFGEEFFVMDTTIFNASWGFRGDSAMKVLIWQSGIGGSISFYKGLLPLKMYWDREAFYSDSLPFVDKSPAPRAQGILGAHMYSGDPNGMACPSTDFVLLTDTSLDYGSSDGICTATDSLVFFDLFGGSIPSDIYKFQIVPWTGFLPLGVPLPEDTKALQAFPNPASGPLSLLAAQPGHVRIVNLYGHTIFSSAIEDGLQLDLSTYPPGIYYAIYQGNSTRHVLPIVLTK